MTKQEEIREGIKPFIQAAFGEKGAILDEQASHYIMEYLHSQGVVIKVDREHPRMGLSGWLVAVEPLIKED